jgi:hypothetical protein
MYISDMPNVPPQNVPVMIAQANQVRPNDVKTIRTIGVCEPTPNNPANYSLENVIEPKGEAAYYLRTYENQNIADSAPGNVTILQQPKHGVLRLETEANHFGTGKFDSSSTGYAYLPETGYLGKDSATMLVEIGGFQVKVVYFFQAINGPLGNTGLDRYCAKTGYNWKISSNLPTKVSALPSNNTDLSGNAAGITVNVVDFDPAAD